MHTPLSSPALALALAAACPLAAMAQTATLPPVVVVGESAPSAPATASVDQARAALARVPGGTNLAEPQQETRLATLRDALDYQPGIIIQDFFGGADQPRLSIRGSGIQSNPVNRGVLLLQDGLPLNEADGSFVISLLEPRNAAYITARRGGNATTPGATTLGGEIDFTSLTGADETGRLRVEAGSYGRVGLQAAGGLRGRLGDARVSVTQDMADGYRHHSRSKRSSMQANAGFRLDNGFENRTYLQFTDLDFKIPAVVPKDRIHSDPRGVLGDGNTAQDRLLNVYARDPRRATRQWRVANRSRWGNEALRQQLGVYWQNTDDLFNNQTSHTATDSHTTGAQWQLSGQHNTLSYRLGLGWANSRMDRDLYATNPQNGQRLQQFGAYALRAENRDAMAGLDWQFAPAWQLVGDLKWSSNRRDADDRNSAAALDQQWTFLSPRVGMNWTPTPSFRAFANLSRSHEAPTFWEILTSTVAPANPASARAELNRLDVQRARTVELGAQGYWGPQPTLAQWTITAYRSQVKDELIATTDANGIRVGTYNYAGNTRHQGLEAGVRGSVPLAAAQALDYRFAWTYSDFRFREGEFAGNQIAGVPRHLISAEILYRHGNWRIGPNVRWLPRATPTDHANTADIYQDPYALLGVKLDYQASDALMVYVQIDNLTDRRYASSYAIRDRATLAQPGFLQGTGRSLAAGLTYHF